MSTDSTTFKPVLLWHSGMGSVLVNATEVNVTKVNAIFAFDESKLSNQYSNGPNTIVQDFLMIRDTYAIDGYLYGDELVGSAYQKFLAIGSMMDSGGFSFLNIGSIISKQVILTVYKMTEKAVELERYGVHIEATGGSAL